jgi:hypothetical protein
MTQMTERDFIKTVETRELEDGSWQYGFVRQGQPVRWACGTYVSAKAAIRAAVRRHYR